jgi:hypothetical protein
MPIRIIEDRPGQRMVLEGTKEGTILCAIVVTRGNFSMDFSDHKIRFGDVRRLIWNR